MNGKILNKQVLIKLNKTVNLVVVLGFTTAMISCSKKSDGDTSTSAVSFSNLAEVTGPVTSASSALTLKLATTDNSILAATDGVSLSSPGDFTGKSLPLCENTNYLKEILREAAGPDKILCYMGKMREAGVIPSTLDISDGEIHYLKLVNLQGGGGGNSTPYVKFQLAKNGNSVSSFKMWSCFSGTASTPTQSEYISEVFNELNVTVNSKNKGTESGNSYGSSMTASGNFTGGSWATKNISGYRYFSGSSFTNVMTLDMNQYSDRIDLSIAMNGTQSGGSFANKFYTVAQIINATKLSTFALGNGSTKYSISYTPTVGSVFSQTGVKSWNADTKNNLTDATTGDYYSKANSGTIPTTPNSSSVVTFDGAEAWDCTLPEGSSWVEADFNTGGTTISEGMQACENKFLGNGNWIQCPYQ